MDLDFEPLARRHLRFCDFCESDVADLRVKEFETVHAIQYVCDHIKNRLVYVKINVDLTLTGKEYTNEKRW